MAINRGQPARDNNVSIIDFSVDYDTSLSFKYEKYVIGWTGNDGKKILK